MPLTWSFAARLRLGCCLSVLSGAGSTLLIGQEHPAAERTARFGEYHGFSKPAYDDSVRSVYVTVRDGVRLAVDIIRPTRAGAPAKA